MSLKIWNGPEAAARIPHLAYDKAQLVMFIGRRGEGKTFAMSKYIETAEPRVFLFDPFDDFEQIADSETVAHALDEMAYWPTACRRRVKPPIGLGSLEYAEYAFEQIVDGPTPLRNCLLVLDEITLWSGYKASQSLQTLIFQGRRLGLRLCVASQRLAKIPDAMLSEATHMVIFKFVRPRDLDVLEFWTDKETAEGCRELDSHQCLLVEL